MKVIKIFKSINKPQSLQRTEKIIPPPPINYDRKNVTIQEFREYVQYLAKYKINKTFLEPDRFITESEREELKSFREKVHNLAVNGIDQLFYC